MYTDTTLEEVVVFQNRMMDMHQNLAEIATIIRGLGSDATIPLQLNSLNVYLPRIEILILNSVAKARTDQLKAKYKIEYPERETKKADSPTAIKKAASKPPRKTRAKVKKQD